jgi:hypothetical protein
MISIAGKTVYGGRLVWELHQAAANENTIAAGFGREDKIGIANRCV